MQRRRCGAGVMLVCTAGLLLGAAAPPKKPGAEGGQVPELPALLARVAQQAPGHPSYSPWAKLGLQDAREVILGRKVTPEKEGGPVPADGLAGAEQRAAKAYGLSAEAARAFVAAQLLLEPPGGWFESLPEPQAARALEAHRDALRAAPGNLAVLGSLAAAQHLMSLPAYEETLLAGLDAAPVERALQLARARFLYWNGELAAYAVGREPAALPRALEAVGLGEQGAEPTVFYLAAYRALSAKGPVPLALSERLLRNLLKHDATGLALELLGALPAPDRQALLAGQFKAVRLREREGKEGPDEEPASGDVRLDVALALVAAGRRDEARTWREAMKAQPSVHVSPASDDPSAGTNAAMLLEWLLGPAGADPFELLLLEHDGVAALALRAQALAKRYPEKARSDLELLVHYLREREDPFALRLAGHLPFLQGAQQELAAARAHEAARLEQELRVLPTPAAAAPPDPQAARIAAQLATPPLQVFTERAQPKAMRSAWRAVGEKTLRLPEGFWPVRIERSGAQVVAAALSQRLDPAGEVSGGGYWLLLSRDGGAHWQAPLYTGLRHLRPYELEEASPIPMLEGGVVRLAASVRELDQRSISFPPIALQPKREQKGRLLEAPLAALTRDRDGDGLTDLVEDRLLLDPDAADTDGDGARDGSDVLPQVVTAPEGAEVDARAQLVSALLFELTGGKKQPEAIITGLPPEGADAGVLRLPQAGAPTSLEDLHYLALDRRQLRQLRTLMPTVALDPEELTRARERFGPFFPMRIEVYVNAKGDQALLVFDEGWRGGSFLAQRKDGHWVLEPRGSWIT